MEQKNKFQLWEILKNEIQQNYITYILLILLFVVEYFAYRSIDYPCELIGHIRYWHLGIGFIIVFGSILVWKCCRQKVAFSIVKRFFNNALGLKFLSFVFIIAFLVHISWLSDTCLDFFVMGKGENCWLKILVSLFGIISLLVIFPASKREKSIVDDSERKLLVTGIQDIKKRSLDLLLKPFGRYSNIDNVLVLLSERVLTEIQGITEVIEGAEEEANNYIAAVGKYKNNKDRLNGHEVCNKLGRFLSKKIQLLYPSYAGKIVNFKFSEIVDYNDFNSCYLRIRESLNKEERETQQTVIHISPGTGIVSGVMTIFAIKGKRELIFTRQDNFQIAAFDIDVWTTKDLLDELIDEIEVEE